MNRTKKKHNRRPGKVTFTLLGLALIILIVVAGAMLTGRTERTALIRIPADATTQIVRDSLTKYCGETYANKVLRLTTLRGTNFAKRHGAYELPAGTSVVAAAHRLSSGAQTPIKLTINGFRNLDLLCDRIASKLDFPADELRQVLRDSLTLSTYGLNADNAMALFLDDTYEVFWSTSPQMLVHKIGKNYLNFWDNDRHNKAAALGITPADAMILASLADEETNVNAEKGTIARLYLNRLHKKMRLQSDPTIRFALNDYTIRRIRSEHLKVESPYNTYRNAGLPPGPIRTTSARTVDALLQSAPSDYLYMCAKEDFSGTHNFASSFEQHSRNARRYRDALNKRGII